MAGVQGWGNGERRKEMKEKYVDCRMKERIW
jgi:hypothetical protein